MEIRETYKSSVGWYLVIVVERFQKDKEDIDNPNRMCSAWENTYLVKAKDILHAYDKIIANEEKSRSNELTELNGKRGVWIFEGVTDIVPIYKELEDLSEILWTEQNRVSVKTVKSWVYDKCDLESRFTETPSRFKK